MSETVSPLDYTPVASATASSSDALWGLPIKLSIQCRGGRTDVTFGGVSFTRRADDYSVAYTIDEGRAIALAATSPPSGAGIALKGDVVALLQALPYEGTLVFRITASSGPALEGHYALSALKTAMNRLATPCGWPSK